MTKPDAGLFIRVLLQRVGPPDGRFGSQRILPLHIAANSMARASTAPQRGLSLTEELEKLEQSITLTLQGLARLNLILSPTY